MKTLLKCLVGLVWVIAAQTALADDAQLQINSDKVIKTVDDRLYGQFLEHIYHSIHGGLWGDIVLNRSFEEAPPSLGGRGGRGAASQPATQDVRFPFRHWRAYGKPSVSVDTDRPLNSQRSLHLVTQGGEGIAQDNLAFPADAGTYYGSIHIRGRAPAGVVVRLADGPTTLVEQTITDIDAEWRAFNLSLQPGIMPTTAVTQGTLQIIAKGPSDISVDQVSLTPATALQNNGLRPDLLKAVEGIKPSTIRWPGGSYVHTSGGYDWKGGIGPQWKRVGKVGWDELDPSAFGTDEFMTMCRMLGTEPVIVVYMGPQTTGADRSKQIQDAVDWVEYCNGPATSKWGAVRAANGHAEPYNVKYWEIDNEIWNTQPAEYVKILNDFVIPMKKVDPTIHAIACGSGGFASRFGDGDIAVIEQASNLVDFLSLHHYENIENYAKGIDLAEAYFKKMGDLIDQSKNPNFKIYFSEWNVRRGTDWRAGLYAGGILNAMERSKYVAMACPALWLRSSSTGETWDNAFINFDQSRWFPAPNYVVMKLYRDHFAPNLVESTGNLAGLNLVATKSADGRKLIVKAVNPTENPINVKATLSGAIRTGKANMQLVAPGDLMMKNSFEQPENIKPVSASATLNNGELQFAMPKWSVAVLEIGAD